MISTEKVQVLRVAVRIREIRRGLASGARFWDVEGRPLGTVRQVLDAFLRDGQYDVQGRSAG